jgi:RHS repeat-associated protein
MMTSMKSIYLRYNNQKFVRRHQHQQYTNQWQYSMRSSQFIVGIMVTVLLALSQWAQASTDVGYQNDLHERLQIQKDIEPLPDNLAGDNIDYFTGNVNFVVTDVSIPGNFDIPVQVRRVLSRDVDAISEFGDWELSIPQISGVFHSVEQMDCQNPEPPIVYDDTQGYPFSWRKYHKGLTITDGNGYTSRLIPANKVTPRPFDVPDDVAYYTKKHWLVKCEGKNFIAQSPTGVTYTFDNLSRTIARDTICSNGGEGCIPVSTVASRATKVEDRFGNYVTYSYASGNFNTWPVSISASDGRRIDIEYYDYLSPRISRVEANGRVWQYRYHELSQYMDVLHEVVLPDDSKWVYRLYDEGCDGPCESSPKMRPKSFRDIREYPRTSLSIEYPRRTFNFSVQHPEGALVDFTFKDSYLHRFDAGFTQNITLPGDNVGRCIAIHCRGMMTSFALAQKVIHYDSSDTYQWDLSYSENERLPSIYAEDGGPISDEYKRQTTTIRGPDSIVEIIYHRVADIFEGAELSRIVKNLEGVELSRTDMQWEKGLYFGGIFMPEKESDIVEKVHRGLNVLKSAFSSRLVRHTITENGDQYHKVFSEFNEFEAATKAQQYNDFSSDIRYVKQGYQHDFSHWILNMPTAESVSDDNVNFTVTKETTYYPSSHAFKSLPYEAMTFGRWVSRASDYYASGEPKTIEFNEKLKTSTGTSTQRYRYKTYSGYKRGKPQRVTYTARYSDTAQINTSQNIDDNGWINSITDLNQNTTDYFYDKLGRLTAIDLPDRWTDTLIVWETGTNGNRQATRYQCELAANHRECNGEIATVQTLYYDRMLRERLVSVIDPQTGQERHQNRRYNSLHSKVFESHWSTDSNQTEGIHYDYDVLQRLTSMTEFGGGTVQTQYLSGNRVSVTNTRGYESVTTYLAYGGPSYEQMTTVASPEGVTTTQRVNLFGNITSITQTGPGKNGVGTVSQTEHRAYNSYHQLCKVQRQDVGQTVYQNSALGELQWSASGVEGGLATNCESDVTEAEKVTVTYDNLGGSRAVDYPDTSPDIVYSRDTMGNIIELTTDRVAHSFSYNSANLLESEQLSIDSRLFSLFYGYNDLGERTSTTYPDSDQVHYRLNRFGEVTQVNSDTDLHAFDASYFPSGEIQAFNYGNGIRREIELNSRRLPSSIREHVNGSAVLHYGYEYDSEGNVTALTDHINNSYSINQLQYDGLDRLASTSGGSAMGSSSIEYDGLSNITRYDTLGSSLDYQYDTTSNRLLSVTGSKSYSFQYNDKRGNVTHNGSRSFTFNRANQLTHSENNRYLYDGFSRRVKTEDSHGTGFSVYSREGQLLFREADGKTINYIYLNDKLIAEKAGAAASNHSGYLHYRPFGGTLETARDEIAYSGHKFDTDLGLSYMQARYYDPTIGRFYSNDPVGFNIDNPMSFNRYVYANNNPYRYVDPDGREVKPRDLAHTVRIGGMTTRQRMRALENGLWKDHTIIVVSKNNLQDESEQEEKNSGEGYWVITNVDMQEVESIAQIFVNRLKSLGDEGRVFGSDGKDLENTVRHVTQTWTAVTTDQSNNMKANGFISVRRRYGETRVIRQTYNKGKSNWHAVRSGSYFWQPIVGNVEFEGAYKE